MFVERFETLNKDWQAAKAEAAARMKTLQAQHSRWQQELKGASGFNAAFLKPKIKKAAATLQNEKTALAKTAHAIFLDLSESALLSSGISASPFDDKKKKTIEALNQRMSASPAVRDFVNDLRRAKEEAKIPLSAADEPKQQKQKSSKERYVPSLARRLFSYIWPVAVGALMMGAGIFGLKMYKEERTKELVTWVAKQRKLPTYEENSYSTYSMVKSVDYSDSLYADKIINKLHWADLQARNNKLMTDHKNCAVVFNWMSKHLDRYKRAPLHEKVIAIDKAVDDFLIGVPDSVTYKEMEHWATPVEAIKKGKGDCEDHAILKMAACTYLGIAEDKVDLVMLDGHAVLAVNEGFTARKTVILDNLDGHGQTKTLKETGYKPYFYFNAKTGPHN